MLDPTYAPFLWILAGLALCAAELAVPGAFLIWIGCAAVTLGLVKLMALTAIPFGWSLILFALLAIAYSLLGRQIYGGLAKETGDNLNKRAQGLVGREFTLVEAIVNGEGKAKVLDSVWRVSGVDAPAGARVRVTGVESQGAVLKVEAA
ncbi:MAG: NfeD family protein [Hyphomicrobiales bacterium]|nr:NfeD family protein [Hyphomicrobiales bacterium]